MFAIKDIKDTRFVQITIGERLRKARDDKHFKRPFFVQRLKESSRAPVESRAEMTVERLKQWEYGNNPVGLEWIPAICEVLECDVGYLFGDYPEKTRHISDTCLVTGLSEAAVSTLNQIRRHNQMTWQSNMTSSMISHPAFRELISYMLRFATAGDNVSDLPGSVHPIKISLKDIYQMRINNLLSQILYDLAPAYEALPDYRWLYEQCLGMYKFKDAAGNYHSLDEIRSFMEQNGLEFDEQLFEGERQ